MAYLIYSLVESNEEQFVTFWSNKYRYSLENLYVDNIGQQYNDSRIMNLFIWKNGKNLSTQKQKSVRVNYINRLGNLPVIENINQGRDYFALLNGGIIWNLFWLHCINPNMFPIFDQHTYRAHKFIADNSLSEIDELNKNQRVEFYFNNYIPFFNQFTNNMNRRVDKALFMFGKYLKTWPIE
jgi:hypothetical protein